MPGPKLKRAGYLRAGFHYQDLVAVEALIDFYRDPKRYEWVQLEAEETAFRSVDDVVARRPDGRYDVVQVKFTPEPEASGARLSWDWLLAKQGSRGRSLLEKWASAVVLLLNQNELGTAALRTDRIPDDAFQTCLDGQKVNLSKIDADTRTRVLAQVNEDDARRFFQAFEFRHSEPHLDDLEEKLRASIAFDVDYSGWQEFRRSIENWSTRKNSPEPDGRIRHVHLVQALSLSRPRPIPQDFEVPDGYVPPDLDFDEAFLAELRGSDGVAVLWGSPGRGKSTYLSHCSERLLDEDEVCIRHHYFLSTQDRTAGRFHYQHIADSLMSQGAEALPDLSIGERELGTWIEAAGRHLLAKGKRLIIIVDGLDHVWREGRSTEHMAQLFANLLPLPPGVRLAVGTQKVADEYLPVRLLQVAPKETWKELPLMSADAVLSHLKAQDDAGRLDIELNGSTREIALATVAGALLDISSGLPLHLIYSIEALVRRGMPISADEVRSLPSCPDGDIRTYYRGLWTKIDPRARDILHALAGVDFAFPPSGIRECFGVSDGDVRAYAQIDHLLERLDIGVLPFHGSIFAFVREQERHADIVASHSERILGWLASEAPEYWQWAWLWVTRARFGAPEDLLSGPDRAWALEALANGYPIEQLDFILGRAEEAAFSALDLTRVLELRCLKTRISNAPEFQTEYWASFVEASTMLSRDPYPMAATRASFTLLNPRLMAHVLRNVSAAEKPRLARSALAELNRRIKRREGEGRYRYTSDLDWRTEVVRVAAYLEEVELDRLIEYVSQFRDADLLMSRYASEVSLSGASERALQAASQFDGRRFEREVFATICREGIDLRTRPELGKLLERPPFRCLALLRGWSVPDNRYSVDVSAIFVGDEPNEGFSEFTTEVMHSLFFWSLAAAIEGKGGQVEIVYPERAKGCWLAGVLQDVHLLACSIGDQWRTNGTLPSARHAFTGIGMRAQASRSYDASRQLTALRRALVEVAVDAQALAVAIDKQALISGDDIRGMSSSPLWLDELWLGEFSERRVLLHDASGARQFIDRISRYLNDNVTEFADRANVAIQSTVFALDNGQVDQAIGELHRAAACLIGYGWRKDPYAFSVLTALEHLISAGVEQAGALLLDIAGQYHEITNFTDGDETNHARTEYYELLARQYPERAARCYAALIRDEDWSYASDLALGFVSYNDLQSQSGEAFLNTFIEPREIAHLEKLATKGRADVLAPLVAARRYVGQPPEDGVQTSPDASGAEDVSVAGDGEEDSTSEEPLQLESYPPGRIEAYVDAILRRRDYRLENSSLQDWLKHWVANGKAAEALAALETMTQSRTRGTIIERVFDDAFEIALQVEGRSRAFRWLVHAHRHRHGWQRWFASTEETHARLDRVAELYADRWREFVVETSKPLIVNPGERAGRVLGLEHLVYFLIKAGQTATALDFVKAMVRILRDETSPQPIKTPVWAA